MYTFDTIVYAIVFYSVLAMAVWAFVDALARPAASYVAAGKLTKPGWMAITGIAALVLFWRGPMDFFGLPAVIAAVVYLVDVRPAVRGLHRGNSSW